MSGDYRGEGLGYYYTRLQAQREQERNQRQKHGRVDSATQIGALGTKNTTKQVAQTDGAGTSSTPLASAGVISLGDTDKIRNTFLGSLAWTRLQVPRPNKKLQFQPLLAKPLLLREECSNQ